MSLIIIGISSVKAFKLAAGIASDGSNIAEPGSVLVSWKSVNENCLHQVYINGELVGTTSNPEERKILLPYKSNYKGVITIQVFAVSMSEALIDFSSQLEEVTRYGRIQLNLTRHPSLPYGGGYDVYSNSGDGEINLTGPVNSKSIPLWASCHDKTGFGMSSFGNSDFGYDGSAALGFGMGSLGDGDFGFDSDVLIWQSQELTSGKYSYAIKVSDGSGICSDEVVVCEDVVVIAGATCADELRGESYDRQTNTLVLSTS